MKLNAIFSIALSAVLAVGVLAQDDLLGKKRGGGSGGSSGGSSGGVRDPGKSGGSGGSRGGGKIESPPAPRGGGSSGGSRGGGKIEAPPPRDPRGGSSGGSSGGWSGGSSSGNGQVRIDPGPGRGGPVRIDQPRSRSGEVRYGSSNNVDSRANRPQQNDFRSFPMRSDAARRAEREDVRPVRYRSGYYHYDRGWRDDYFNYPYYWFSYRPSMCVPSPWYLYPHMPAYLSTNRITVGFSIGSFGIGATYHWQNRDWYDRDSDTYELDVAVRDLVDAFERRDMRSLEDYLPSRGSVVISNDWERSYSIRADDFYDMMSDLIRTTRTNRYRIREVRRSNQGARVLAEHEFIDTWGRRDSVYHLYTLEAQRRGYTIIEFGTSHREPW